MAKSGSYRVARQLPACQGRRLEKRPPCHRKPVGQSTEDEEIVITDQDLGPMYPEEEN